MPVCVLCHERCGQFLCPCCGMHAPMPAKCDLCQPHTEPCMAVLLMEQPAKPSFAVGCLVLLTCVSIIALAIIGAVQVIRAVVT